jgi:NADPH:quinone reductase-like Zn-dependent oxidoreductase
MQAVQFARYGGPEVLVMADQATPSRSEGERLIEVHAVSVNPIDWKLRSGLLKPLPGRFPATTGRDGAGIVTRVAAGEDESLVGARICFLAPRGVGTWAQELALPAASIAFLPPSLGFIDAAALPLAGLSAWAGLVTAGRIERGNRVLIHGGAGGVGGVAVQLARHLGAYVISTCSARNAEFVRGLGAHEVIPYDQIPFETVAREIDLALDLVGGDVHGRTHQVLRPGGALVYLNAAPIADHTPRADVRVEMANVLPDAAALAGIVRLAADGILRPHVEQVLPFERFREAQAMAESGVGRGKIVLAVR